MIHRTTTTGESAHTCVTTVRCFRTRVIRVVRASGLIECVLRNVAGVVTTVGIVVCLLAEMPISIVSRRVHAKQIALIHPVWCVQSCARRPRLPSLRVLLRPSLRLHSSVLLIVLPSRIQPRVAGREILGNQHDCLCSGHVEWIADGPCMGVICSCARVWVYSGGGGDVAAAAARWWGGIDSGARMVTHEPESTLERPAQQVFLCGQAIAIPSTTMTVAVGMAAIVAKVRVLTRRIIVSWLACAERCASTPRATTTGVTN